MNNPYQPTEHIEQAKNDTSVVDLCVFVILSSIIIPYFVSVLYKWYIFLHE